MGAMKDFDEWIKSMENVGSEMNSSDTTPTFDFLSNDNEVSSDMATLTISVDVDCKLYCDGDFLDELRADEVKKVPVSIDQHIITIESKRFCEVKVKRVVDANEAGKKYVLMVDGLKEKEKDLCQKHEEGLQRQQQEAYRIAEKKKSNELLKKALGYYNDGNYGSAVSCFKEALQLTDDVEAQFRLGHCYYLGEGTSKDNAEAFEWFKKAAEQGHLEAQYRLGACYFKGEGVVRDYGKAMEWYTKAAEQGHLDAQCELGKMFLRGYGVPKNSEKGMEWLTKAAEQGSARAQCELGECYDYGEGVIEDRVKAVEWYTKAAEQGYVHAQFELGQIYVHGLGVEKDGIKAVEWYTKAAEQGSSGAQVNLGSLYYDGYSGLAKQNYKEAVKWFTKAAEQGDSVAQEILGDCYYFGTGVAQSNSVALDWYEKAADQGDEDAIFRIKEMANKGDSRATFLIECIYKED